ncbi:hydroxycarboxylic acid receptor 2 [Hemibagrus wyckioides]|uniref:hydroxycarboxylic acid receptor 2 n=1 Tax=Hemibagrus wyckioides TaxID=337641 RepID=UPI00266BF284|nr:hydroxycarboxylic acid receptor 2 [Hemibagrus wyckioides]
MLYNMTNSSTCVEAQSLVASALTPMLILDFILGLPGNILALWLLSFKAPWKSANIYLLNLALADVLLLIALPFHIDSVLRGGWIFGDPFCRIKFFMLSVNQSASIAFITVMVVDRFYRIIHPHHPVCHVSIRSTVMVVCGIWVAVLTLHLPLLVTRLVRSSGTSSALLCQNIDIWTDTGAAMRVHNSLYMIEFVIAYLLVFYFSVRIFYHINHGNRKLREHRRVKRTIYFLLVVLILFTFCFLPSYITGFVVFFLGDVSSCSPYVVVGQVFSVSLCIVFLNSALDVILYTLSCANFRDTLKQTSNSTGLTKYRLSIKEPRAPRRF